MCTPATHGQAKHRHSILFLPCRIEAGYVCVFHHVCTCRTTMALFACTYGAWREAWTWALEAPRHPLNTRTEVVQSTECCSDTEQAGIPDLLLIGSGKLELGRDHLRVSPVSPVQYLLEKDRPACMSAASKRKKVSFLIGAGDRIESNVSQHSALSTQHTQHLSSRVSTSTDVSTVVVCSFVSSRNFTSYSSPPALHFPSTFQQIGRPLILLLILIRIRIRIVASFASFTTLSIIAI